MNVVDLSRIRAREMAAVLRCMLERVEAGEIAGLALCARSFEGNEEAVFSGIYRIRSGSAAQDALRLSWKLTQEEERHRGPP